jgi:16S rRNA A1518/A1519 N6-dimethyltransferase RsmA/KsgA/DIM1 with predicted DNA glycosylase/AP lyase activity
MKQREIIARELLALAKELVAVDDEEEVVDETFRSRVMGIKSKLPKLAPKKNKRLKSLGIDVTMRPSATTVEDLIGVLEKALA